VKKDRLKKYEAKSEETDIDIYFPYYSELGLPVEEVNKHTVVLEGLNVPETEILVLLKAKAFSERKNSVKGRKDLIDLISLFYFKAFDFKKLRKYSKNYKTDNLLTILGEEIKNISGVEELNLNIHKMAKFKEDIIPKLVA